jgi:hypothetical protein
MMANAISTLALSPIKTQRQKSIYAASEAAAIAVRKCVVDMPVTITETNVRTFCVGPLLSGSTDVECNVLIPYIPPGSSLSVPHAVVCKQAGVPDSRSGEAWQPLYKP